MYTIPNDANFIDRAETRYLDWMAGLGRTGDRAAEFIRTKVNHRPPHRATPLQTVNSVANNIFGSALIGASIPFTLMASAATRFTLTPVPTTAVIVEPIVVTEMGVADNPSTAEAPPTALAITAETETREERLDRAIHYLVFHSPIVEAEVR